MIPNMTTNKSFKIGVIAYANSGGIGIQSKRLVELIKPDLVIVINSSGFSQNKELNLEWYKDYQTFLTIGFPTKAQVEAFLPGLTHIFTVEDFYNPYIVWRAKQLGVKTICQVNYEFCENLDKPYLPVPDLMLMPSHWKIDKMKELFPNVHYLPPPLDPDEFAEPRDINIKRKGKPRFLHTMGTLAYEDRNGTLDLLKAVKLSKVNFELVIRSQHPIPADYATNDKRIIYDNTNYPKNSDLYKDFDALILPRRYGGLCLPMWEALSSSLPVIMTDGDPNNKYLPANWLVKSIPQYSIMVKALVGLVSADHQALADRIDEFAKMDLSAYKKEAFEISKQVSPEVLKQEYLDAFHKW